MLHKTEWDILFIYRHFCQNCVAIIEILPLSGPQIFLRRRYFYRAIFELCDQEISHQAAVLTVCTL